MSQGATIAEVLGLLERAMATLEPAQRAVLEQARIAPRVLAVADSPGGFVVAVAAFGDALLYWSEARKAGSWKFQTKLAPFPFAGAISLNCGTCYLKSWSLAMLSNLPVNTDAHGRPLPSVAPSRVRRLRLR